MTFGHQLVFPKQALAITYVEAIPVERLAFASDIVPFAGKSSVGSRSRSLRGINEVRTIEGHTCFRRAVRVCCIGKVDYGFLFAVFRCCWLLAGDLRRAHDYAGRIEGTHRHDLQRARGGPCFAKAALCSTSLAG